VRRVGFDHTVIRVSDWERSNAFYRDVLGAELVENPEAAGNPLGAGPTGSATSS
jgi:catechol 2,3-dioxygenase-like lactoylglutathione lyase family enzyme